MFDIEDTLFRHKTQYDAIQEKTPLLAAYLRNCEWQTFVSMVEGVELTDNVVRNFGVARNFAPQEDEDPNVLITSLDFHRNSERCVTSRNDGVMSMINCLSGTVAKTILTKRYGVGIVRFTHHLDCVIFSSANSANDHRIRYHSFFDNKFLRYYTGHTERVTSLMMHPTADQFISAGLDGTIRLWDIRNSDTSAIIRTDRVPASHVCAAYDQEGVVFGVYTEDHLIRMYDARNYQEGPFAKFSLYDPSVVAALESFLAHIQEPNLGVKKLHALDLKFSPDGNQLLVTSNRGVFLHLDAFEGKLLHLFKEHRMVKSQRGDLQLGCCYSADGAYVLTGAEDGRVFFYKSATGQHVHTLPPGHNGPVLDLQWNPKRHLVASAGGNSTVLWSAVGI